MELDITAFVRGEAEPFDFSRSAAEWGPDAGLSSWRNAIAQAEASPLLTTPEHFDAMRDFIKGFGAWDADEIAAISDADLNAMLIQFISGDMRESGMDACDPDDFDWAEYERRAEEGQIFARIYRGDDARIYFYLGA